MKAGNFNINEYLEKLYENAETGNLQQKDQEGIIIPDENKKSYDWLKREYDKAQTEVKVEITGQGASFKPGYDLQASTDSVKDFKPGIFGEIKTADTPGAKEEEKKPALDTKKEKASFQKDEGEPVKKELPKTSDEKENIKNKEEDKEKKEESEKDKEEKEEPKEEKEEPEVKKIDLKTKKK